MADRAIVATRPGLRVLVGGGIAGVMAAVLMGTAGSIYLASIGAGWSTAMQAIAGTFYKSMAFVGGPGVTAIGVLTHLAVGGAYGAFFALITLKIRSRGWLFLLGIPYAIAIWAFMTWVTLPVFDWVMFPRVEMIGTFWFFLHWIYGGFLGLFIPGLRGPLALAAPIDEAPPLRRTA